MFEIKPMTDKEKEKWQDDYELFELWFWFLFTTGFTAWVIWALVRLIKYG